MGTPYFAQEFKDSAVKQVVESGYPPKEVADRSGSLQRIFQEYGSSCVKSSPPVRVWFARIKSLLERIQFF